MRDRRPNLSSHRITSSNAPRDDRMNSYSRTFNEMELKEILGAIRHAAINQEDQLTEMQWRVRARVRKALGLELPPPPPSTKIYQDDILLEKNNSPVYSVSQVRKWATASDSVFRIVFTHPITKNCWVLYECQWQNGQVKALRDGRPW
jgi:hypothetical protein